MGYISRSATNPPRPRRCCQAPISTGVSKSNLQKIQGTTRHCKATGPRTEIPPPGFQHVNSMFGVLALTFVSLRLPDAPLLPPGRFRRPRLFRKRPEKPVSGEVRPAPWLARLLFPGNLAGVPKIREFCGPRDTFLTAPGTRSCSSAAQLNNFARGPGTKCYVYKEASIVNDPGLRACNQHAA